MKRVKCSRVGKFPRVSLAHTAVGGRLRNRASYVAEWQNEVSWSFKIESVWSGLPETLSDPNVEGARFTKGEYLVLLVKPMYLRHLSET